MTSPMKWLLRFSGFATGCGTQRSTDARFALLFDPQDFLGVLPPDPRDICGTMMFHDWVSLIGEVEWNRGTGWEADGRER